MDMHELVKVNEELSKTIERLQQQKQDASISQVRIILFSAAIEALDVDPIAGVELLILQYIHCGGGLGGFQSDDAVKRFAGSTWQLFGTISWTYFLGLCKNL